MKPIVLKLKPETRQNLEILSSATGVSRSDIVSEAVDHYVNGKLGKLVEGHRSEEHALIKKLWNKKI